mgnify:CR=1 FL=1
MKRILLILSVVFFLTACRKLDHIAETVVTNVTAPADMNGLNGFYLINEGMMGTYHATLDYFDFSTGNFHRNVYATNNRYIVTDKIGFGDVGNDIAQYGSKLYAVLNCSGFVEVMNVENAEHIAQIAVPNCRNLAFSGGYAYVSSFAGPVSPFQSKDRLGYVAKIDTATFTVVDTCTVGLQPEQMLVSADKIYVANSGGYRGKFGHYDNTVSVIDIDSFTQMYKINVGINPECIVADKYGRIYVSSRGDNDYTSVTSCIYVIDAQTDLVVDTIDIQCSDMDLVGDSLYVVGFYQDSFEKTSTVNYMIYNVRTQTIASDKFITDGTEAMISRPYGVRINPVSHQIYVTDAKDCKSPGMLFCYSPDGILQWYVRQTGEIPSRIAFVRF